MSIGSYKGIPINPGTDAEIQAQIQAIDNRSSGTPTGGGSSEPTIASQYKKVNAPIPTPYETELARVGQGFKSSADSVVDEDKIRNDVLRMFQTEIDATNSVYANKLAEAKQQGLGRLGSTRAVSARSGTLGSDFGIAQKDKVVTANNEIENSIVQEKLAKIAAIQGKGSQIAAAEIAAKRQAQQEGLKSYMTYLSGQADRTKGKLNDLSQTFLSQGIGPNEIDPAELEDIATKYGVSTSDILAAYGIAKKAQDAADLKTKKEDDATKFDQDLKTKQLALQQEQARVDAAYKNGQLSLAQYNAQTSRINALSTQFKAGLDAAGNPIKGQASQLKNDALTSANALLKKFDDGSGTSAVGKSRVLGLQHIPGTAPKDFQVQFDNLKSLISLDNVKLLKGQGAVSDAERALLAQASSKLDLAQSEEEFRSALVDIISSLSGPGDTSVNGETTGAVEVVDPDGIVHTFPDQASADAFKRAAGL